MTEAKQTTETLTRALRLASVLQNMGYKDARLEAAGYELRRLHEENVALLEALKFVIRGVPDTWEGVQKARAAIARCEGEKQ